MNRILRWLALVSGTAATLLAQPAGASFDFAQLKARAQALAAKPYAPAVKSAPEWLQKLTYDQHRQIEFDPARSLWRGEGRSFQAQFFHPGWYFNRPVQINEVAGGRARPVAFKRDYFRYHQLPTGEVPADLGFAGFRLLYPVNGPARPHDELGAFLGASYFRLLAAGAYYGLSARGLALNTAEPGPEEFPVFSEFWLEQPAPGAKELALCALLESESVVGAYRIVLAPGETTVAHVRAAVFVRKKAKVFGVAPLTSMFWRGENTTERSDDFRPEVHDSDGLLLQTGAGEWIWRPLQNPAVLRTATFADRSPRGFGLLQRDRNFESYQDLEAHYHKRPGAWVEPVGDWGRGGVRLVEIPTKDEFNDNVVAFWIPETPPAPGTAVELEYRIHWSLRPPAAPGGFVHATRQGRSLAQEPDRHRFIVDFDGERLRALAEDAGVEAVLDVGAGATELHRTVQKNDTNGMWRVAVAVKPDGSKRPVELRCFLRLKQAALTETWSYLWQP